MRNTIFDTVYKLILAAAALTCIAGYFHLEPEDFTNALYSFHHGPAPKSEERLIENGSGTVCSESCGQMVYYDSTGTTISGGGSGAGGGFITINGSTSGTATITLKDVK